MKPYLLFLFLVSFSLTYGQKVITGGEYWFNHDYTTQVNFEVTHGAEVNYTANIDVSALNNGLNTIHFRFCDNEDIWGNATSSFFVVDKINHTIPSNQVIGGEYWFDHNFDTKISVALTNATEVSYVSSVDISNLNKGLHTIHYRFQDKSGKWSPASSSFFVIDENRLISNNTITSYQYWLDNQIDKAITINITPDQTINLTEQIDFTTLVAGTHQISFRFLDNATVWSNVITETFIKNSLSVDDGLIAHYQLDGNADDLSIYQHNGTVSEAIPATDRFGNMDAACYFDGVNDFIQIPDADHLDIQNNEPFSVSLWLRHDATNNAKYFLSKYNGSPGSTGAYAFGTGSAGDAYSWFYFVGEGGLENRGTLDLNDNQWHHFVSVYKPGESVSLYIDGQLDISNPLSYTGNTINTLDLFLGCGANKAQYYRGFMDDVRLYKRALNTDEINGLYNYIPTAAKPAKLEGITVFPNPVRHTLKVNLGENKGAALLLYNMTGSCVYSAVTSDVETEIPMAHLEKGIYLMQIKSRNGQSTFKIIKE